jgi:uncharacterized membrane protein
MVQFRKRIIKVICQLQLGFTGMVLASVFGVTPAEAQLRVCNNTNENISIAVAYKTAQTDGFASKGWFNADAGECSVVIGGPLQYRYYYIHADGAASTWAGDYSACTAESKFNYSGGANCASSGFGTDRFFRVDTGDSSEYRLTLAPKASPSLSDGFDTFDGSDAVKALAVGWRKSAFDDGTRVMQIHNYRPNTVSFDLKCFTRYGASKTLQVSVGGKSMSEVGFLQGWPNNFEAGERCEAYYANRLVWQINVPS